MALTELQLPSKDTFYNALRQVAQEILRTMLRLELIYEFIDRVDSTDLDAMGVSSTDNTRSDLQDFRNTLAEFSSLWIGNSVTPAKDPQSVIDKIRRMSIL